SGTVFCGILHRLGFSRGYIRGCLVFFLFHWELLVWSSLLNLKDTLVMTLTIIAFELLFQVVERVRILPLAGLALVLYLFASLRFYVPVLLSFAPAIWLLLRLRDSRKLFFIPVAMMIAYPVIRLGWAESEYIQ